MCVQQLVCMRTLSQTTALIRPMKSTDGTVRLTALTMATCGVVLPPAVVLLPAVVLPPVVVVVVVIVVNVVFVMFSVLAVSSANVRDG